MIGLEAEKKATMSVPPLHVNTLPPKMYLDETVVPVVMRALQEVAECRPDNPLEFMAMYILKHNPEKQKEEKRPAPSSALNLNASIDTTNKE